MKKTIYLSIIVILTICLIFILYKLSIKEETITQTTVNKTVVETNNIKQEKDTDITKYTPKDIDKEVLEGKLNQLNKELEKTKNMMKTYNKTNTDSPIKSNDVDDLLNMEIDKKNIVTSSEKIKTENEEIKKLQQQIEKIKKTINTIKE